MLNGRALTFSTCRKHDMCNIMNQDFYARIAADEWTKSQFPNAGRDAMLNKL